MDISTPAAKYKIGAIVDRAMTGEETYLTRRGERKAVVVGLKQWQGAQSLERSLELYCAVGQLFGRDPSAPDYWIEDLKKIKDELDSLRASRADRSATGWNEEDGDVWSGKE